MSPDAVPTPLSEPSPTRAALLDAIAREVPAGARTTVAIDGVDGAGKTVFADQLAEVLRRAGRGVVRASVDGFHHPRELRYARGRHDPEGFFRDSYDYAALVTHLLDPFAAGRPITTAVHDVGLERAVEPEPVPVGDDTVLVLDGIFLHRPELADRWGASVFLRVGLATSIARCAGRDGGSADAAAPEHRRYVDGQRLYLRECAPERAATVVVDNTDLDAPRVVDVGRGAGSAGLGRTVPALPVRDVDAAVAHYVDRFGFVAAHVDPGAFAVLERDDARVHLWQAGHESWRDRDDLAAMPVCSGAESFLAGTASCRIEVADVDALFAELRSAGVLHDPAATSVTDTDFGTREFATVDLDGNLVEFYRWV